MKNKYWTATAFAIYVAAIVGSNWLITHMGINVGHGTHLTEVGFGLLAPSGVYAAAISFPARDFVQRFGGRVIGFIAILVAAAISYKISSPVIAIASGGTYAISESLDMLVYTPLQKRWFVPAVAASFIAAIVADSVIFLHWAGLYSTEALKGLIVGKAWMLIPALVITYLLRKRGPQPVVVTA